MFSRLIAFSLIPTVLCVPRSFEFKHHDNSELGSELSRIHRKCPSITRLYQLGHLSVRGAPLLVLEFSDNPGKHEALEPEFKYVANMHGDEVLGRELLLKLADDLCHLFKEGNFEVTSLINATRIHLMPSMNPDGWEIATKARKSSFLHTLLPGWSRTYRMTGRENANNVDLNRDFPNLQHEFHRKLRLNGNSTLHHLLDANSSLKVQPETQAVMEWIVSSPFVLSANFHGGALVANYPFDDTFDGSRKAYTASPDDGVFIGLSHVYANNHPGMRRGEQCSFGDAFEETGGITNGAAWYAISGSMQDFNYLASNALEITLEVGCDKYLPESELQAEWEKNKLALMEFMWRSHQGVKGFVVDASTNRPIRNAEISIVRNVTAAYPEEADRAVTTTALGEFWRILPMGPHRIQASAPGYRTERKLVFVPDFLKYRQARRLNFKLQPENMVTASSETPRVT